MDQMPLIRAHAAWKGRLFQALCGGEIPDAAIACDDARCDLGKWIVAQRDGPCAANPDFVRLAEDHRAFHQSAGAIIGLVREGKFALAKENLLTGDFDRLSVAVAKGLIAIAHSDCGAHHA